MAPLSSRPRWKRSVQRPEAALPTRTHGPGATHLLCHGAGLTDPHVVILPLNEPAFVVGKSDNQPDAAPDSVPAPESPR